MTAPELVVMAAMVVPVPLGATPPELSSRAMAGTALRWYLAPRHWYSWKVVPERVFREGRIGKKWECCGEAWALVAHLRQASSLRVARVRRLVSWRALV